MNHRAVSDLGSSLYDTGETTFRVDLRQWLDAHPPPCGHEPAALRALLTWYGEMASAGFAGLHWPLCHGGSNRPLGYQLVQQEELARRGVPHRPLMVGLHMVGPLLMAIGTASQRDEHLGSILHGQTLWTQLFSEPDAGSDLASLRTTARRQGDGWVIDGQKVWSSYAHVADMGLLLARTDPSRPRHAGLGCFLVPMRAPGVEVLPLRQMTGDAEFNQVRLDRVALPAAALVGGPTDGWAAARVILGSERTAIGLSYYAKLTSELDDLAPSVGADSGARQRYAALYASVGALRLMALRLASDAERGLDLAGRAGLAKLHATREWHRLADLRLSMRPAGGIAFEPLDLTSANAIREALDARSLGIGGGTTEIQRTVLGEQALGLPREPRPTPAKEPR